jgi:hypothetical protein
LEDLLAAILLVPGNDPTEPVELVALDVEAILLLALGGGGVL